MAYIIGTSQPGLVEALKGGRYLRLLITRAVTLCGKFEMSSEVKSRVKYSSSTSHLDVIDVSIPNVIFEFSNTYSRHYA